MSQIVIPPTAKEPLVIDARAHLGRERADDLAYELLDVSTIKSTSPAALAIRQLIWDFGDQLTLSTADRDALRKWLPA